MSKKTTIMMLKQAENFETYPAGSTIFNEGDEGRHMFVIKTGVIELRTANEVIETLESGAIFGEMALLDHSRRSASAVALTDCQLVAVDAERFEVMVQDAPSFASEVMQVMAERLRHMNRETIANRKRAEATQRQAMTDPLTGVANRRGWEERMVAEESRCRRYGTPLCILSIDLDGLKVLNDTLGHSSGDELIKRAAAALRQSCRCSDVIARLGGDEFGVLAIECHLSAGQQLVEHIEESFRRHEVKASIGLAVRNPESDLQHAWEEADQAMYVVKRGRKGSR